MTLTSLLVCLAVHPPLALAPGQDASETAADVSAPANATDGSPAREGDAPGSAFARDGHTADTTAERPAEDLSPVIEGDAPAPPSERPAALEPVRVDASRRAGWVVLSTGSSHVLLEAPAYRGSGLIAAAAVLGVTALVEHGLVVNAINGTCGLATQSAQEIDESATKEDIVSVSALGLGCLAAATPSLILRLSTPVLLGGAVSLAAAGGALRGRHAAFRDSFVVKGRDRDRRGKVYLGVGGGLLAAGLLLWSSTRLSMISGRTACEDITCYTRYDFTTLHSSALLSATGAALLAFGVMYRRSNRRYDGIRSLVLTPAISRRAVGLGLSGRF